MFVFGTIIVLFSLLAATAGVFIALRLQYRALAEAQQERNGWQEAQTGHRRIWEGHQKKLTSEVEKQFAQQIEDMRDEWRYWQQTWSERAKQEDLDRQAKLDLEYEIARLPHAESVILSSDMHTPENWQPPSLYRGDLRGRDLSYRYFGRADLREAQLQGANLYMADLTAAVLTDADLSDANLIGANLTDADLRRANLARANFLVADLHRTLLYEASLLNARNLTLAQLQNARHDSSAANVYARMETTLPRHPSVNIATLKTNLPEIRTTPSPSETFPELPYPVSQPPDSDFPVSLIAESAVPSTPVETENVVPELPLFASHLLDGDFSLTPVAESAVPSTPVETESVVPELPLFASHLLDSDSSLIIAEETLNQAEPFTELPAPASENEQNETLQTTANQAPAHLTESIQTMQSLDIVSDEEVPMTNMLEASDSSPDESASLPDPAEHDLLLATSDIEQTIDASAEEEAEEEDTGNKVIQLQARSSKGTRQTPSESQNEEKPSSRRTSKINGTNGTYQKSPRKRAGVN